RFRLVLRELEKVEGAFDVYAVRGHGRELGARRQQRREVNHQFYLIFRQHSFEQTQIQNRSGDLAIDEADDRLVEPGEIQGHDAAARLLRQPLDQSTADFSTGA